jgi:hypothetical protein
MITHISLVSILQPWLLGTNFMTQATSIRNKGLTIVGKRCF